MYFFYICNLTNDYTKMKKKIMNVCGMAFLAISVLACSGQKKERQILWFRQIV